MKHDHQQTAIARRHGGRGAAPRIPRRVSGPVGGAHAAATAAALPRPSMPPAPAAPPPRAVPSVAQRTGVFARIAVGGLIDRILRGRAWICFVAAALGGIVFMQVWLLKLNTGISRAVQTTATIERQNASLEASIARLSDGDRIRRLAGGRGMLLPAAGDVRYLTARGGYDAARAAAIITPPSEQAKELLALARSGQATVGAAEGLSSVTGSAAAPASTPTGTPPTATATPAATSTTTATTTTAATATPATTSTAPAVPVATPVPTAAPVSTTTTTAAAAAAPAATALVPGAGG